MTPAETFERAADLIDTYGWWQGNSGHGPDGQRCALRALSDAAISINPSGFFELTSALYRLGDIRMSISNWNDAPERTHAEVTSTFRAIAATLRAQADKTTTQERVTA